ncbi:MULTISPECIES: alpha/beta fold hydrolase [Campylobacter]|uniref:alpha/beta fold hydrolase n=1 Tax=Campylobacter TaxID=194 RepID=UPI000A353ABF|nr:alpha/beta hydrolase [Campylobacter sp. P0024]MCR8678569.1 alpha/beta hydrolase [Campylobacter sp. RM19072]
MAVKQIEYNGLKYELSYEILGQNSGKNILILHGWGANKELMKRAFSRYFDDYNCVYLDLPGFGLSSHLEVALNSRDYANIVSKFSSMLGFEFDAIMGHSFGGKVATLLEPKNLILLSSAGIIHKKRLSVRFKIAIFKLLKRFGFSRFWRFFATKDVNNMSKIMYETLKSVVDEDFSSIFANLNSNSLIFWGISDDATPLSSGKKIASLIKNSKFYPLEGDHFFFLNNAKFISQTISKELK